MEIAEQRFAGLIAEELRNIKKYARNEEIDNIKEADTIYPNAATGCVYGIMTGSCWSHRAENLIRSCCPFVVNNITDTFFEFTDDKLIPAPLHSTSARNYYSPVEILLFRGSEAEINNAICFLKGNSELLPFRPDLWERNIGRAMGDGRTKIKINCS